MPIVDSEVVMDNASRKVAAEKLTPMGFPLPLAYYALERANDNSNAAGEWLVTEGIAYTQQNPDIDWLGD